MTSRIYGIAVKETVNYYEYDDIKLVFNQDTKQWSVFSNYDNLWMNGVQYHKGDLVVMFADGKVDTYTMMAQYTDETPYINYIYTITSNFVINPSYYQNGRVEYIFEADPETEPYQFTCRKLLNNVRQKSYTLTDVDIKTYKNQNHGKLPTLFDNMKIDWHGMNPESPYLPYSFTIISNSNYIKDGTTPKQINDIIIQIPAGSGASSYFHRILDETNKHEATPKPGELPSILMTKKIGKYNAKPSVTFNRETIIRKIYHDHTKVYYNGHYHRAMYLVYDSTGAQGCWKKTIEGLAFTYADPFWLCMTTSAGIELGGQVLEAKRLVRCWKDTDDINLTMRKTKSRKKAAPETAPYDDIIYDVVSNASNVTVTKYRRKTKIDAQGHKTTEDIQEDLPIVFDTGDSPVRCWNIEFRAKNNVWTIYSKCGYIRYGGRQYPKNRSILDFNAGEEMHIEIKDETEKYEVDEVITYTVTNVMVTKFIYKVWTVGESYTIKVEKSAENVDPEPWVTVNFYDAWNEHPVVIDDIQLDYDIKTNIWTLSSASDELYYYGRKINKGEKIAEWGFNTIISLKDERGINVISANAEKDVKVHIDSTKSQPQGLDISEFYPSNDYYNVDFLLTHSVTKGEWVITSKRDDTYMNGVRYTYNKVIFQGSDKQGYPDFTFMCQHKKDESGPIIPTKNIMYTITISWDPYEQIGNLAVQAAGGESKVYYTREKDPAKNTIVLTKQNAKSMYGYIWKRDMPGPGPTPPGLIDLIFTYGCSINSTYLAYYYSYVKGLYGGSVKPSKYRNLMSAGSYSYPVRWSYRIVPPSPSFNGRIFVVQIYNYEKASAGTIWYSDDFGETWNYLRGNLPDAGKHSSWYPSMYCFTSKTEFFRLYQPAGEGTYGTYIFTKYSIDPNGNISIIDEVHIDNLLNVFSETNNQCNNYQARSSLLLSSYKLADQDGGVFDLLTQEPSTKKQDEINSIINELDELQSCSLGTYRREYIYVVAEEAEFDPYFRAPRLKSDDTLSPPLWELTKNWFNGNYQYVFARYVICCRIMTRTSSTGRWTYDNSVIGEGPCICLKVDLYNDEVEHYSINRESYFNEYRNFKSVYDNTIVGRLWVKGDFYNYDHKDNTFYIRKFNQETGFLETIKTFEDGDFINIPYYTNGTDTVIIKMNFGSTKQYLSYNGTYYECTIVDLGHTPSSNINAPYFDNGILSRGSTGPNNYCKKLIFRLLFNGSTNQGVLVIFDNPDLTGHCYAVNATGSYS